MALYKSSNPVITEKAFTGNPVVSRTGDTMTVRGTMNRFGFMMIMLMGGAYYTWNGFYNGQDVTPFLWGGMIGGLIVAIAIVVKKTWAPFLAPLYGLLEGLFVGAISAYYNDMFAESMPNIIINAVGLTIGTAVAMFLLYHFRIIKVTERLRSVIITATAGILIFYVITLVLRLFGMPVAFMHDSSMLGIGISLFVVGIASLNLLLDFDMIEHGARNGAPKYMEWFGAFGLLVTLIWLYLEILRLLSRLSNRN